MRPNRTLEIGTGLFVLLGFAALLFLTTQLPASGVKFGRAMLGYHVTAEFDDIGDLKVGSPVAMAGCASGRLPGSASTRRSTRRSSHCVSIRDRKSVV